MSETSKQKCQHQWPWTAESDPGATPKGACGPDVTAGGTRREVHHECVRPDGHDDTHECWCEAETP